MWNLQWKLLGYLYHLIELSPWHAKDLWSHEQKQHCLHGCPVHHVLYLWPKINEDLTQKFIRKLSNHDASFEQLKSKFWSIHILTHFLKERDRNDASPRLVWSVRRLIPTKLCTSLVCPLSSTSSCIRIPAGLTQRFHLCSIKKMLKERPSVYEQGHKAGRTKLKLVFLIYKSKKKANCIKLTRKLSNFTSFMWPWIWVKQWWTRS